LTSFLPNKIKPLNKFASLHKCISQEVAMKGSEVCNPNTITEIDGNENYFYSPSGNYKVELKTTELSNSDIILKIRFCSSYTSDLGDNLTCSSGLVPKNLTIF